MARKKPKTPPKQRDFTIHEAAPDDPIYSRGYAIGVTRLPRKIPRRDYEEDDPIFNGVPQFYKPFDRR